MFTCDSSITSSNLNKLTSEEFTGIKVEIFKTICWTIFSDIASTYDFSSGFIHKSTYYEFLWKIVTCVLLVASIFATTISTS